MRKSCREVSGEPDQHFDGSKNWPYYLNDSGHVYTESFLQQPSIRTSVDVIEAKHFTLSSLKKI